MIDVYFKIGLLNFSNIMLLVHIGIASLRQFQCAPTTYVNSINECFSSCSIFHKLLNYFLCFSVAVVLVFNIPPTAKVIWRRGHGLKVSSDRLEKPGNEPATPGLQGKWLINYTMAAPLCFHGMSM